MKDVDWKTKEKQQLISAFLTLSNPKEVEAFLRDLMTPKEIEEFSSRLEAARLLTENVSYLDISQKTGLSSTTIARISKWLKGPLGGYKQILASLYHHNPDKFR
jgi:TrpR-related protein YerC/YecD